MRRSLGRYNGLGAMIPLDAIKLTPVPKWKQALSTPKGKAVAAVGGLGVAGLLAWLLWPKGAAAAPAQDPKWAAAAPGAVIPEGGAFQYTFTSSADGGGLTSTAERLLGAKYLAMWIYDLNRGVIGDNINFIRAGDTVWVPDKVSVERAPAAALADFQRRYALLQQLYIQKCTPASVRGGRGTINCNKNAILSPTPDITNPTVLPKAGDPSSYAYTKY